jgi:hypothetical protein
MTTRTIDRRPARLAAPLAGFLLAGVAGAQVPQAPQAPQSAPPQVDARWGALLGCWAPGSDSSTPIAENAPVVCVVPGAGASSVEMIAVAGDSVVARERVVADGARQAASRDGCAGWERAEWSADGRRVYRQTEYTCANGVKRVSNGVLAFGPGGEWLDIRGVGTAASAGVIAVRYRPTAPPAGLPRNVAGALTMSRFAAEDRLTAGAPLGVAEVVEVSKKLDTPVAAALLVERGQGFELDAKRLTALADAGVPGRVIDAMVALSYPRVFAVNRATAAGTRRESAPDAGSTILSGRTIPVQVDSYGFGWSPFGWGSGMGLGYGYSPYSRYGYGISPFGWGVGGLGWYGPGSSVVVVRQPQAGSPQGRIINGRGYTRGGSSGGDANPRATGSGWSSRDGGSSGGSSAGSSGGSSAGSSSGSSGGSSGGSTGRTAKPRDP